MVLRGGFMWATTVWSFQFTWYIVSVKFYLWDQEIAILTYIYYSIKPQLSYIYRQVRYELYAIPRE